MKPTLKAPGSRWLKLQFDQPLSSFAFDFNLRRYSKVYSPKEIVIQQGEIGDEMYFIAHGEVEVLAGGHRAGSVTP
jgi:CRP-like cAMP-binding protein